MDEGLSLTSCSVHDIEGWRGLARVFVAHSLKPPLEGARRWDGRTVSNEQKRTKRRMELPVNRLHLHVWEDGGTVSHSFTAVRRSEFLHRRMMGRPRPQPQRGRVITSCWRTAGGEAEETERQCVSVYMCVCVCAYWDWLRWSWPGLRRPMGEYVCQLPEAWTVKQGWRSACGEASWQQVLCSQQRWHVLPGAERKTSQAGCKRSPHQKSVMYAKLRHYEGRTNGWSWCNCLKQGISLSLMSRASVMGLFTLLS